MQVRKYGSILFNKKNKDFYVDDGYTVDDMSEATIFYQKEGAEIEISCLDEPEDFEIWNIEIIYQTVNG